MSKRNLKLLIALIIIVLVVVLSVFFLGNKPKEGVPGETGGGDNFFADLLNFGNSKSPKGDDSDTPSDISGYIPPEEQIMEKMKLVKISSMPIAGYAVFNQERFVDVAPPVKTEPVEGDELPATVTLARPTAPEVERIPILRYVAKENGNIFQTFIDTINERKFSNTLVPGVQEAFFGDNGETVIMRYLKNNNTDIATWVGVLPKEVLGSDSDFLKKITGSFLTDNITYMSISPATKRMFYLFNSGTGAIGISSTATGENKSQIYNGAYTEWLSEWPNDALVTLTTKPASGIPGYMYAINPAEKDFKKVLGNIPGLTTLTSPNTETVLYSNDRLSVSLYDTNKMETRDISLRTLAEKCVWNTSSEFIYCAVPKSINSSYAYPDSWYQGEVSFSDNIWKINVLNGTTEMVIDPTIVPADSDRGVEAIDATKLSLSSDNKYLFFVNKNDSYLWGLELY